MEWLEEDYYRTTEPYDPNCQTYARDMTYLDNFWPESQEELDNTPQGEWPARRAAYVRKEEGTLNTKNGHFLCDDCYIKLGMPTAPGGWVCP